jgi:hypothetical protein
MTDGHFGGNSTAHPHEPRQQCTISAATLTPSLAHTFDTPALKVMLRYTSPRCLPFLVTTGTQISSAPEVHTWWGRGHACHVGLITFDYPETACVHEIWRRLAMAAVARLTFCRGILQPPMATSRSTIFSSKNCAVGHCREAGAYSPFRSTMNKTCFSRMHAWHRSWPPSSLRPAMCAPPSSPSYWMRRWGR